MFLGIDDRLIGFLDGTVLGMRSTLATVLALAAVAGVVLLSHPARADDTWKVTLAPGVDAGTMATTSAWPKSGEQLMMRCTSHSVTLRFCDYGVTCTATSDDTVIDADKSIDLCAPSAARQTTVFRTYDGGLPSCRLYTVNPKTVCP